MYSTFKLCNNVTDHVQRVSKLDVSILVPISIIDLSIYFCKDSNISIKKINIKATSDDFNIF